MNRYAFSAALGAAVLAAGLVWLPGRGGGVKGPGGPAWREVAVADLTPAQVAQYDKAGAARAALFEMLMGELTGAMSEGGAAAAIEVCAERAPRIAAAVSDAHNVRIGRTSWKRRHPANTPPPWAQSFVTERVAEERVVVDRDGRMGVLTPIRVAPACLECHGAAADLAPGVLAELERRYPADEATGFEVGDLRGWFWIEAPAAP